MNIEQARFNMIEQQIRPWDVLDPSVLSLLATLKREDFVPQQHQALAFFDTEIPLGHGQHMLAPKTEARILQELAVQRHEQVLEIGTGSGHMAALLSHKAREVISLEIVPKLAAMACENLKKSGLRNARVVVGDGSKELLNPGPFDVIVLSGSVATRPEQLLAELNPGGRLFAVIGTQPVMQATLFTCIKEGEYRSTVLFDTVIDRLLGFTEPTQFSF